PRKESNRANRSAARKERPQAKRPKVRARSKARRVSPSSIARGRSSASRPRVRLHNAKRVSNGFQHEGDARRCLVMMRDRLGEFVLSLHPEKTRLIEFGRFAAEDRKRRRLGKPETFNFLGFTFICSKTRRSKFQIKRKSRRDRMRTKLQAIKQELRRRMHQPIPSRGNG